MKSMKLWMIWFLVGMGLAMLLSVGVLGSEESVSAQDSTDPVFVGAGDIASCTSEGDEATANLLDTIPGTVYTTGDNAYQSGTASEFANCYEPTWGRFKDRTYPSVGNHEYETPNPNAAPYFAYFRDLPGEVAGSPDKGYYSYNLGDWHMVALNSMCEKVEVGGCKATSPMVTWLKQDLAVNPRTCTLAYFHHPVFSTGTLNGGFPKMKPSWEVLYAANADVVLNGHVHSYERFAPQTPSGEVDPAQGIREFVVGTGGRNLNDFKLDPDPTKTEARDASTFGVLKLTLHPSGYDWEFLHVAGGTFTDSGSDSCDPGGTTPPDTEPPTVISTVPTANATEVAPTTNVTATFSEDSADMDEDMDASTITRQTFKLTKKGSSTKIAAAISYDASTDTATLNPDRDLTRGVTYKAVVTTGAKDLAGNPLAQQYKWFFTVVG
jgi:acid phosphatase type 7